MKSVLLVLLSLEVFAFSNLPKGSHYHLNITSSKRGKCLYNRRNLNKEQLNIIYGTNLKTNAKGLTLEEITRHFNCIFLKRNLQRDNKAIKISPDNIFTKLKNENDKLRKIHGKIKYLGLINKSYKYDLIQQNGITTALVKIHFKKGIRFSSRAFSNAKKVIKKKLSSAEKTWNRQSPDNLRFKFKLEKNPNQAHFSVNLLNKLTRGPYDTNWSVKWSKKDITHEIGHMLGLDDEYDNVNYTLFGEANRFLISKKQRERIKEKVQKDNYEKMQESISLIRESSDFDEEEKVEKIIELKEYYKSELQEELEDNLFSKRYNIGLDRSSKCDKRSFMCDQYNGNLYKWHIYTIFKRFYLEK